MNTNTIAKKSECSACGTSPVNHRLFLISTIIDDMLGKSVAVLFGWVKVPREGKLSNLVNAGFVGLFRIFHLAHFSEDMEKAISGRSKLIWEEATRRGIKMQQVVMFGKHLEQYRAKINGEWIYFQSIPAPSWLPQDGYEWIDDKFKLAQVLEKNNIPVPKVRKSKTLRASLRAFDELEKPVIIKPRAGSRGRHTTTNIRTREELTAAHKLGKQIATELVVEEHIFGSVCRATVVDNKLVGFFRADPPQVTGDGTHSIRELIVEKNKNKNEQLGDIEINPDLTSFIARYRYDLDSIIPKDTVLDLSAKTGRFYGGYTREMFTEVHPKMHEIFAKAGKVIQASIVGFDLIIKDPTADPDTQKWGIIECNSLPFIDLHYFPLEGTPKNPAKDIWDLWENKK